MLVLEKAFHILLFSQPLSLEEMVAKKEQEELLQSKVSLLCIQSPWFPGGAGLGSFLEQGRAG